MKKLFQNLDILSFIWNLLPVFLVLMCELVVRMCSIKKIFQSNLCTLCALIVLTNNEKQGIPVFYFIYIFLKINKKKYHLKKNKYIDLKFN